MMGRRKGPQDQKEKRWGVAGHEEGAEAGAGQRTLDEGGPGWGMGPRWGHSKGTSKSPPPYRRLSCPHSGQLSGLSPRLQFCPGTGLLPWAGEKVMGL